MDLAPEIIGLILDELRHDSPSSLLACNLVNKDWSTPSSAVLFLTVTLGTAGGKSNTAPKTRCRQFLALLTKRPVLSTFPRTLVIEEPTGYLNHRSTKASLAKSLLGSGHAVWGLQGVLPLLLRLRSVHLDGKSQAEWNYVTPAAQAAIYETFTLPSVRHVVIRNFVGCPLTPFLDYGHLKKLEIDGVWPGTVEEEAPFPLLPIPNVGLSAQTSLGGRSGLQVESLVLSGNFLDVILLLQLGGSRKGLIKPLAKHLVIDATRGSSPLTKEYDQRWDGLSLPGIVKYSAVTTYIQSHAADLYILKLVPKLTHLTHLHLCFWAVHWVPGYTQRQFLDLLSTIQRAILPSLEEACLRFLFHQAPLAILDLVKTLQWDHLDAAFSDKSKFRSLRALNIRLSLNGSAYSAKQYEESVNHVVVSLPLCRVANLLDVGLIQGEGDHSYSLE